MPIYAYKCDSCGFAKDVLQKISDAPLTQCPSCGEPRFTKQVTAAGFQLKGSGWYATDFKGGNASTPPPDSGDKPAVGCRPQQAGRQAGGQHRRNPRSRIRARHPAGVRLTCQPRPLRLPCTSRST